MRNEGNSGSVKPRSGKQSRVLFYRGYGSAQLVFSGGSFAGATDWQLLTEVDESLAAGERPLGLIAPQRSTG